MIQIITLEQAHKAVEAAKEHAKKLGIAISIAIVDEHGSIIAISRMDGAIPISPRFAYAKAFTSASLGMPSGELADYVKEGKPYFGLNTLFSGEITPIAGGVPVTISDKLAGGIGVGGSTDTAQDLDCAKEALKALS